MLHFGEWERILSEVREEQERVIATWGKSTPQIQNSIPPNSFGDSVFVII